MMLPLGGSRRALWGAADVLPRRRRAEIGVAVAAARAMAETAPSDSKEQAKP